MFNQDRDYTFVAKTFDAAHMSTASFVDVMLSRVVPVWRGLHEQGSIVSVQLLRKIGDIDMQTSTLPVRDWRYFALLELSPGTVPAQIHEREIGAGVTPVALADLGVQYLSNEVLMRPAGAGTALPRPSSRFSPVPANQQAAVEYIQIPSAHWEEYRQFMREFMGPVGVQLVQRGHSYQICILERIQTLHHDRTLPDWNRIHILWGEFDNPDNGFFKHSSEVVRDHVGRDHDMYSVLSTTSHYRLKPRMSKNVRIEALCLPPVDVVA